MWAEGILAERCLLGARVSGNVGSAGRPRSRSRPRSCSRPYPAISAPVSTLASTSMPVLISAPMATGTAVPSAVAATVRTSMSTSSHELGSVRVCMNIHCALTYTSRSVRDRSRARLPTTCKPPCAGPRRQDLPSQGGLRSTAAIRCRPWLTGEEASNILRKNAGLASQKTEESPHLPAGGEVEVRRAMSRYSEKGISEGCRKGPPPKSRARPGARGWACA